MARLKVVMANKISRPILASWGKIDNDVDSPGAMTVKRPTNMLTAVEQDK